jgi:error-prone DNA polymerase
MYLNCHSHFSLKYGTLSVAELVREVKNAGGEALALTDINNTSALFDFLAACKAENMKPVWGIEFRNNDQLLYTALAMNNNGVFELNRHYSTFSHARKPFPETAPGFENVAVIYPLERATETVLKDTNTYIGIRPAETNMLFRSAWRQYPDKLLAFHPVTFKNRQGYNLHRLLRCIDHNVLLSKLGPGQQASIDETLLTVSELLNHYKSWPRIIFNTQQLMDRCQIDFDPQENKNRKTFTGSRHDDRELLQKLALEGTEYRYNGKNHEAVKRVHHELEIIDQLGFAAYFLITWDIVRYARSRGFYHVGRGSGANSIVAYCLGITDVDPIELDLYFERFLNQYRTVPPDFDIDFSWKDRDQVMDYIFKRYGSRHTALMATYVTFQGRSVIRELGKVFGLPKAEIDRVVKYPDQNRERDHITKLIFKYGQLMEGMPGHLSVHAGGILITEKPMHAFTATDIPPKGFPITHFDMFVAEDNGFYKYDILSQRGLGHIKDALKLIYENRGVHIDIHQTEKFKKDEKVNRMLASGETIGCFYIESPAMRQLLQKLHCRDYHTLVAASSIIRPGVAKSGMMREYIHRYHHPDDFEYIHPEMEKLLKETHGVMVYQEDVIKVAHHFAGLGLAESDVLRRGMSGKRRSKGEMQKIRDTFFENCRQKGIDKKITAEVWRQIESFSGYSFSKAHSASFAVESYQSLYLKTYYPFEFMVAVINNFGGFYNTEFYLREAQRKGAAIEAPCINHSEKLTVIEGKTIFLGFGHVQELESKTIKNILEEWQRNGLFTSLENFTMRLSLPVEQLNLLIRINAFRFTGKSKKNLLWEAQMLGKHQPECVSANLLFPQPVVHFQLPQLLHRPFEQAFDEIELLGFPMCSPFELLADKYTGTITVKEMPEHYGKTETMVGNLNTIKNVRTVNRNLMQFAGFWDKNLDLFDTVHFPGVSKKYPFAGPGFYLLQGKITEEFGVYALEVVKMEKIPLMQDPRMGV